MPRDPATLVDGDAWWTERKMIARKLLDAGEVKLAYAVSAGHGAVSAEKQIEAEFQAGWIALRFLKDTGLAAKHFSAAAAISATPISVARIAYWQGRAAETAGDPTAAQDFFEKAAQQPTTYYGQLACAKLGRPQVAIRPAIDPASPERVAAGRGPVASAVSLLYAAGLRDAALPLVTDIARSSRSVAELDAVGDVVLAFGDARALLALGKGATQRGLALDHEAFPTIGIPSFEAVGDRVEKAMVYAIARQESRLRPGRGIECRRARADAADARHRPAGRAEVRRRVRRRAPARRRLQRPPGRGPSRRAYGRLEGLLHPHLRVLQRGRGQREEVGAGPTATRATPRSTRSTGWSASRSPRRATTFSA